MERRRCPHTLSFGTERRIPARSWESHLGPPLKPGRSVLILGVSRRRQISGLCSLQKPRLTRCLRRIAPIPASGNAGVNKTLTRQTGCCRCTLARGRGRASGLGRAGRLAESAQRQSCRDRYGESDYDHPAQPLAGSVAEPRDSDERRANRFTHHHPGDGCSH